MICIAAFIILLLIWLFTPAMKIFGFKKQAENINKMFKKSLHCFSRRATFRACDSNFGDEIKHSILRKLIVKHKKWVKPVSWAIEVVSFLIIVISIWSLLTVVKSGLALYTFGTCDVQQPDACALSGSEACTIDGSNGNGPIVSWFTDWGEIFLAMPSRWTTWNAEELVVENSSYYGEFSGKSENSNAVAVDIFDPGCIVCRRSFTVQKESGFFEKYRTHLIPYVITSEEGDKFENSKLLAQYFEAIRGIQPENGNKISPEWYLAEKIFTGKDASGVVWQENFNGVSLKAFSAEKVEKKIAEWLKEAGYSEVQIKKIAEKSRSEEVSKKLEANKKLVEDQIKTKKIPTMIFDGKRHEGQFKAEK
ncbi:MAG: hypothetical protein WAV68_03685 [Candidatus Nanogingivalis sp.]